MRRSFSRLLLVGLLLTGSGLAGAQTPLFPGKRVDTVHVGDTLRVRYSIRTDTVLSAIGGQNIRAAKCGSSAEFRRDSTTHGTAIDGDTINIIVVGCETPLFPDTTTSVSVTIDSSSILIGHTAHATAVPRDSAGNPLAGRTVSWASVHTGIATISSSGVITGLSAGTDTITATIDGHLGKASLVINAPTTVSVVVTIDSSSLQVGHSAQATAVPLDGTGHAIAGRTVAWVSSNTSIALVASSGSVFGVSAGTDTITATIDGIHGKASLVIVAAPPPPPSGADEPTYSPSTGTLVAADSIDEYTSAHAMRISTASGTRFTQATNSGEDPDSTLLMSGGHSNPTTGKFLRLVYGGDIAGQDARAWYFVGGPTLPVSTTHYFSYWARVTFSTPLFAQPNQQAVAMKWFMLYHTNGDRIQWNTHDNLPCNHNDWAHTNNYWQVYDNGTQTSCQGNQPIGPGFYPGDIFNSQWHRFTYAYKANSAPGARDGFARMWVDGTKVIDVSQATVGVTPPGGYKTWCDQSDVDALVTDTINVPDFGSVLTSRTPPFTLDIDDFIWWHGL